MNQVGPSYHPVEYDDPSNNQLNDGGGDMYDGGNIVRSIMFSIISSTKKKKFNQKKNNFDFYKELKHFFFEFVHKLCSYAILF